MEVCPNCALINAEGATTCSSCGHSLRKRGLWGRIAGIFKGSPTKVSYEADYRAGVEADILSPTRVESPAGYDGGPSNWLEAEGFNEQARAYLRQGEYRRAIGACNEAIRRDPSYAAAHYNRGLAYLRSGNYQDAIDNFGEAIRLTPEDSEAHMNRGLAFRMAGRATQVLPDYDEAMRLEPMNADVYLGRGAVYFALGQFERSVDDFSEAIRLVPELAYAYNNRAWGYIRLRKDGEAERDAEKAQELGLDPRELAELKEAIENLKNRE